MPGAGKSVAVEVARKLGLPVFSMGDRVREAVTARGLALDPDAVGRTANEERQVHGADIWARRTLQVIAPSTEVAVIDGARSLAEVDAFRTFGKGAQVTVLAVQSSPRARASRLRARARSDDDLSDAGFDARDHRELTWGIGEAVARADLTVVNEGSLAAFKRELGRTLRALAPGRGPPTQGRGSRGSRARPPRARPARGTASTKRSRARSRGKTPRSPGRRRVRRRSRS
jgi:dephospho-CoA kinase